VSYVFAPNRDAGCVSRNRNPNTRRRPLASDHGCGLGCAWCNPRGVCRVNDRVTLKHEVRAHIDEVITEREQLKEEIELAYAQQWEHDCAYCI
jgi:hypothetical protein